MWKTIKHVTAVLLGILAVLVFVVLVWVVLYGVYTREFRDEQARWSEELARFLLVWVSFLGGAIAYLDDKHLGVDILVSNFDASAGRWSRVLTHGLVFAFAFGVMGIGGTRLVIDRFDSGQVLPAMKIAKAWFYLAVPVSGFLISLFAAGNVVAFLAGAGEEESRTKEVVS
jgi:TRAP-type C4-dicarboxylate transport system permease small subunit